MECLLPYLCMVTVPHIMVGLERMSDYRGVGLVRFHCILNCAKSLPPGITCKGQHRIALIPAYQVRATGDSVTCWEHFVTV